ncbi:MAG TPA: BREX-4 system phosphatase PglZ, partial [Fervidobacterium sp.]|nr:BREX-4 system phosphatase PglZ [Fervidobacterium sp.]
FATRFILVDTPEEYNVLLNWLRNHCDKVLNLADFCSGDDVFPMLSGVLATLDVMEKDATACIVGVSEFMRLVPEKVKSFFSKLFERETAKNRRIYLPLFRGRELLSQLLEGYDRVIYKETPDVLSVKVFSNQLKDIELTVAPFAQRKVQSGVKLLNGVRELFTLWSNQSNVQRSTRFWLKTEFAGIVKEGASSHYTVQVYKSAWDFLTDKLKLVAEKNLGTEEQWTWLAENVEEDDDFDRLASRLLNRKKYSSEVINHFWKDSVKNGNGPKRWLSWLWAKLSEPQGSYLRMTLDMSNDINQFEESVALAIFDANELTFDLIKERKKLLLDLGPPNLPKLFWEKYNKLEKPESKLAVLTDFTDKEKCEAVRNVGDLLKIKPSGESWIRILEITYPTLFNYLTGFLLDDEFANKYFNFYRKSRIMDCVSEEHAHLLEEWNQEKLWLYDTRHSVLEKVNKQSEEIIWIDALGLEWLGVIAGSIDPNEYTVECKVVRAELPTVTTENNEWKDENEFVRYDLDENAHDTQYKFPDNFVKALDIIEDKVNKKLREELHNSQVLILTSDHGLSRFAAISNDKVPTPDGYEARRGGRYASLSNTAEKIKTTSLERYPDVIKTEGELIQVRYRNFIGSPVHGGEIHGGASPEEVLVPVIRIAREALSIKLTVETPEVEIDIKGRGLLVIRSSGSLSAPMLQITNMSLEGHYEGENKWSFLLEGLRDGEYSGSLYDNGRNLGEVKFKVKKRGAIERSDDFDF